MAFASTHSTAATTAQTSLGSITVTPLARAAGAPADWRTICDYEGGNPPAGVRITATAPWIEPAYRLGADGVTWAFPNLPNQTGTAQDVNIGFAYERPIADYPTRVTIHYTAHFDQFVTKPWCWWSAFKLTSGTVNYDDYVDQLRGLPENDPTAKANYPIHATGPNTVVMNFDGKGGMDLLINDKPCNGEFLNDSFRKPNKNVGAMLINGFAIRNHFLQQPAAQGDWFTVNSFKIEQQRPDPAASSVAAVDLDIPGTEPVATTIEVTDNKNNSRGYVLRDVPVYPGHYRLYWDGIDQKQGMAHNTAWIPAGDYSFHLTTSHAQVHYAGQPNNSTGKYNFDSWGLLDCTSLCMTPPGTTVVPDWDNAVDDKRGLQGEDSVQLTSMGYDAKYGQWITSDGYYISGRCGSADMQCGRGTAITPPNPAAPKDPTKQFYFCSKAIGNGDSVVSATIPAMFHNPEVKKLTSPDWNRGPAGFQHYKVRLGGFSQTLWGPQHHLLFLTSFCGGNVTHADWIFRNIRFYEEGQPDPGPITFDRSKFRARRIPWANKQPVLDFAMLRLEDNGHSVHLRQAVGVDYPYEYNVTPHTIMAFDLNVIDASGCNLGNGIGLSPDDATVDGECGRCVNIFGQIADDSPSQFGIAGRSKGIYAYPQYAPNTLYTDHPPLPPPGADDSIETSIMWQPGFYGLKVSEDSHLLFACNNADNRIEVRDISTDGHAVAKIPFDHPMYLTWAADGALGAPKGTRYIFVDSPTRGVMRIPWHTADNTFGRATHFVSASEFAYPRGLVYSAADNRLFVVDGYNLKRTKIADQIVVIDPQTGNIVSRFGKRGGVDPKVGGYVDDQTFTCPLTIDADSKGAIWINDFYTAEVRKYDFDPATNGFKLERRINGPNTTNVAHFYWMPGDPPTRTWTVGQALIRTDSDMASDGLFTNQRNTSTCPLIPTDQLRPFAHTYKINGHSYFVTYGQIGELVGDGFKTVAEFGRNAGDAARDNHLLAAPGQPPTELDKAIAASGDKDWAKRSWAWSDLDGDGKMSYSAKNPEFQIGFNSTVLFNDYIPASGCLRPADAAYVHTADGGLAVFTPTLVNGRLFYTFQNTRIVPIDCLASDVIVQDGRYFTLSSSTQRHDIGDEVVSYVNCYDVTGKKLWSRDQSDYSIVCLQPLGNRQFTVMDRGGWTTEGPVIFRNDDGDLITEAFVIRPGDCWSNGALRVDDDTAYIGIVQAYKATGLSTAQTGIATATLPQAGL